MGQNYYWLKLQKTFFASLEIKTILKQEKGAEYVIFWQKLLLEVIDKVDSGFIRYRESIPYTPEVLSTITDTDIDTVKGALNLFRKMGMLEIGEKGDLIIDAVIHEMIGRITDEGIRKRKYRQKIQELKQIGQCPTVSQNVPTILDIELEKEIDIDTQKETPASDEAAPVKKANKLTTEQNEFYHYAIKKINDEYVQLYSANNYIAKMNWDKAEIGALVNIIKKFDRASFDVKLRRLKHLAKTDPKWYTLTPRCLLGNWNKIVEPKVYDEL